MTDYRTSIGYLGSRLQWRPRPRSLKPGAYPAFAFVLRGSKSRQHLAATASRLLKKEELNAFERRE
jgi:hypothetical protein